MSGIQWKAFGSSESMLHCCACGSTSFSICSEPVERKRHTKTAHRRKVVAMCPGCKQRKRLKYGAAFGRRASVRKRRITS